MCVGGLCHFKFWKNWKISSIGQLNPEHTVPTLVDDGHSIWDSHVIIAYLVDRYGKDDQLYPKDLIIRAKINQRLFFEASALSPKLRDATYPIFFHDGLMPAKDKVDDMYSSLDILETFLGTNAYLAGDNWTIADVSVANTILLLQFYAPLSIEKHSKILAWLDRIEQNVPYFAEINGDYPVIMAEAIEATVERNKLKRCIWSRRSNFWQHQFGRLDILVDFC